MIDGRMAGDDDSPESFAVLMPPMIPRKNVHSAGFKSWQFANCTPSQCGLHSATFAHSEGGICNRRALRAKVTKRLVVQPLREAYQ